MASYLDHTRLHYGADKCRADFRELAKKNMQRAADLLNDRLLFATFFTLLPEIEELALYEQLNDRNRATAQLCAKILKNKKMAAHFDTLAFDKGEIPLSTLKWILSSGAREDGYSSAYDRVIDGAASLLINIYKDKDSLPIIADLIFKRNRKGAFIHDLVWVFFQAHEPDTLEMIARYLRSKDKRDVELGRKLLDYTPANANSRNMKQYESYRSWLRENYPYLYFTGESFQYSSKPHAVDVNLGAKYLCKGINHHSGKPEDPLTEIEYQCLECFQTLNSDEKQVLSKYSHQMHNQNEHKWKDWMLHPIEEQVNHAKTEMGGKRWL